MYTCHFTCSGNTPSEEWHVFHFFNTLLEISRQSLIDQISQIPQCTGPISHNVPFRTDMCTFPFWMVYCGTWDRCIVGFVKLFYWAVFPPSKIRRVVVCRVNADTALAERIQSELAWCHALASTTVLDVSTNPLVNKICAQLWKRIGVMVCKYGHILTAPEHLLTAPEDL